MIRTALFLAFVPALAPAETVALDLSSVKALKVKVEQAVFKGRAALRVADASGKDANDEGRLAILSRTLFQDGTIEVELAGEPGPGAAGAARGFVGVAFRAAADGSKFECFYLRPTNGRADDQVRRNHSAQYISVPGFPWQMLRKQFPEKYESYVDLVPAEWTKVRIEVQGSSAKLYVHGAAQPVLIVNDLKQAAAAGAVALWVGPGTLAHFTGLKVTK